MRRVRFSPDGSLLTLSGEQEPARVIDFATQIVRLKVKGHADNTSAYGCPDRRSIFTEDNLHGGRFWYIETGQEMARISLRELESPRHGLQFTKDGKSLYDTAFKSRRAPIRLLTPRSLEEIERDVARSL